MVRWRTVEPATNGVNVPACCIVQKLTIRLVVEPIEDPLITEPPLQALIDELEPAQRDALPFGKVLLRFSGDQRLIKAAASPRGRSLLRNEAAGVRQLTPLLETSFRVAEVSVLRDDDALCALEFTTVDGDAPMSLRAPYVPLTPLLRGSQQTMPLTHLLDQECHSPALKRVLLGRHGNPDIPVTPSHGDFIYWNLLCVPQQRPGLIDFEYYSPARMDGYDDLHFRVAPWLWRCVRAGLPAAAIRWVLSSFCRSQRSLLKPDLVFDLFVVHWMHIAETIYRSEPGATDHETFPRLTLGPQLLRAER